MRIQPARNSEPDDLARGDGGYMLSDVHSGRRARVVNAYPGSVLSFPGGTGMLGWIDLAVAVPFGPAEGGPDDDGTTDPDDDDRDGEGPGPFDPEPDPAARQPVPVPDPGPDGPIPGSGDGPWDPDKDPADPRRKELEPA